MEKGEKFTFSCLGRTVHSKRRDGKQQRVLALFAPTGTTSQLLPVALFDYQINDDGSGTTFVHDANANETRYSFDDRWHLTAVEERPWLPSGRSPLYRRKRLRWGADDSSEATNLLSYAIEDEQGKVVREVSYRYDAFGNIIARTFSGDLTGEGAVDSDVEHYQYDHQQFHLMTSIKDRISIIATHTRQSRFLRRHQLQQIPSDKWCPAC